MNFSDIFKKSFVSMFSQTNISTTQIIMTLGVTCIVALYIFAVYRLITRKTFYNKNFNISLAALSIITAIVILTVQANIVISLGMVGALSIVRFRTAIKDPRDAAYIFWAIAVGICCGVSDYLIAGIGTFIIFLFLALFGMVRDNERIMIVVRMESKAVEAVENAMTSLFEGKAVLRVDNHSVEDGNAEVIYEVSDKMMNAAQKKNGLCSKLISSIEGVKSVSFVRQDDEINQ